MRRSFRIYNRAENRYETEKKFFIGSDGILYVFDDNTLKPDVNNLYIVEYETEFVDKDEKVIFENDIISVMPYDATFPTEGIIAWDKGVYVLLTKNSGYKTALEIWDDGIHNWFDISKLIDNQTILIGSIHEEIN